MTSCIEGKVRRRAEAWLDGGLLDAEFYGALRNRNFAEPLDAALDWVTQGMPARLSPHPMLDFASLPPEARRAWSNQKVRVVLAHLTGQDGRVRPVGPLADVPDEDAARLAMTAAARKIASAARVPEPAWDRVEADLPRRTPGRVSVVIPTHADSWFTTRAVQAVLTTTAQHDVEVIVVDNGCPTHTALALAAAFLDEDRVRILRLSENRNFAGGSNLGFVHSTGELVVFLNNDTRVRGDWLDPLLATMADRDVAGAQPLLLFEDDTIQSAGTVFLPGHDLPCALLVGHPAADGLLVEGRRFSAATAAAVVMRAEDVARLEGFDEGYRNGFEDVDLCLRALALRPGGFRVVPESIVTHHKSRSPGRWDAMDENRAEFARRWADLLPTDGDVLAELGFVAGPVTTDEAEVPAPRLEVARRLPVPDSLRWSINLPSTPGFWGDTWGDTYFGEQLAEALREIGQDVVLRRYGAHTSGPTHLDDVALSIRGRERIDPVPGCVNVLWVISHPESVEPAELDGFDLVFAASESWSQAKSAEWGRPIEPLLQATAVDPSALGDVPVGDLPEALFVGNTDNGRRRDLVHRAVESGIPLAVYGRGWEGLLPEGVWRGEHVPNRELPVLYRRHGVVLADHWPDMARHGFVANRVFDAVASGAQAITDEVAGVGELFEPGTVVVARSGSPFPSVAGRRHPGLDPSHTFRARARSLLTAVRPIASARVPA